MATLGTRIFTWLKGDFVGEDDFGNKYYRERGKKHDRWERRWVIYNGPDEASKVPPVWHQWLHKTIDTPPSELELRKKSWEKEHIPNRTGTVDAYRPSGHEYKGATRARASADYEPWRPS
ncbi:MAG: NADH:ubiquinone oxidoreductase subunit NDUFA12 [Alphaproteobacteria bacterium]|nr:NADH:ubiquinone oxidoreductase subunit NDUFA12 [Alphaproteobacteria bacterium]